MQTLKIQVFIENMPKHEQKLGARTFFNNLLKSLKDNNIFCDITSCGSGLNLWSCQMNITKSYMEKKFSCSLQHVDQIKKRYPDAQLEVSDSNVIVKTPEKSLEERIKDCFDRTIRNHQWSSSIHFGSYNCVRPIRKISLKLDKKFISGQFCDIIFSSFEGSEKFFDEKKEWIYKKLEQYFVDLSLIDNDIVEENCASIYDPEVIIIGFKKDHLDMPFDLIKQITEEFFGFAVSNSSKCVIIVEKNVKVPEAVFEKTINEKMDDLHKVFQRDMKSQSLSLRSKEMYLGNNLGKAVEKTTRMKKIAEEMGLKDLVNLIDIYYYDLSSQIVQSYPSLKGVITQKVFSEGQSIREAHKSEGGFDSQSLKALEYIDNVMLLPIFTSTKDPFAMKKQIDFLIEFFKQYGLCFDFQEKNEVFMKRAKARLKDHRRFVYCNTLKDQISVLASKPLILSSQKIIRILNIVKNSEKSQHIEAPEKMADLNLDNLTEGIDSIIEFIETNQINPYIERIETIEKFISQIESIIDVKSLIENEV
jgi:glycyl-tRNA synthetase beta subunit